MPAVVLLWLLVVNLGIALGAGLYEARIVVPDWVGATGPDPAWHADVARRDNTGLRFWVAVTTVPLTLLTLGNLVAGWRAPAGLRKWWLATAATALIERALTLGYFVPTMVRLMQLGDSPRAASTALQWVELNNLRHLLVLAAWLAALKTFSLVYVRRGRTHRPPHPTP